MYACASVQGQHVEHYAQRAVGLTERTTMVSAYIMDDWQTQDNSSLKASRTYSVQSELYHQWAAYRLDALATRAAAMQVRSALPDVQDATCWRVHPFIEQLCLLQCSRTAQESSAGASTSACSMQRQELLVIWPSHDLPVRLAFACLLVAIVIGCRWLTAAGNTEMLSMLRSVIWPRVRLPATTLTESRSWAGVQR